MIRIITDSTADFTVTKAKENNIDFASLRVVFPEHTYLDQKEITGEEFYEKLSQTKDKITTSLPSPQDFYDLFEPYVKAHDQIICITISSKISGTYQSACVARDMFENADITVVDSSQATIGLKLLIDTCIKLRDEGKTKEEILDVVYDIKNRIQLAAVVDTLEYFVRGGRLSKAAGMAGKVLKLKPIVALVDGALDVIGKGIGSKKATEQMFAALTNRDENYPFYIGYTGEPKQMESFINQTETYFGCEKSDYVLIGPVIGVHAGPGAKAISYVAKK